MHIIQLAVKLKEFYVMREVKENVEQFYCFSAI